MRLLLTLIVAGTLLAPVIAKAQPAELMVAARDGDLEVVNELLEAGAQPDPPGIASPLYFAAQGGHLEIVKALLEYGADPNSMSKWGAPLHIAARRGHVDIVQALLDHGADPNLKGGEDDDTPLHMAAVGGSLEAVESLVKHGADVNARNRWDHPPAHSAAYKKRTAVVSFLLSNGAMPRAVEPLTDDDLAKANPDIGRSSIEICRGCHALEVGEAPPGRYPAPNLANVLGREKAGLPDFPYSDALRKLSGTWTPEEINQFIADPTGVAPGTEMGHVGVQDADERIAIIAYLLQLQTQ